MDIQTVCHQLLECLGGATNVKSSIACVTRLRVSVHDLQRVDLEAIKRIDGVLGVVASDTVQVVFGPGTVGQALDAFHALCKSDQIEEPENLDELAANEKNRQREKSNNSVGNLLKKMANVFVPLLPGIIAAGLINGIVNVINAATGAALNGMWWYETIRTLGWALFAYLPIFAGFYAAREFGGTPVLGGIAGAICVANSAMPLVADQPDGSAVLLLSGAAYNPAQGGLIAALLAGAFFALLERGMRRVIPPMLDSFVTPFTVLVIGGILVVAILQPAGTFLSGAIYTLVSFFYTQLGVLGGYLLSAGFLPLVSVGLHQALAPIHAMLNDPSGPTGGINYLLPILMMSGGGQIGAGLALMLKTKNRRLKSYIRDSIPVGILGVGEPLMYAVTLPLGKPFVTACLGAGFGGALATLFQLGAVSQGVSGLFGLLIIEPGQQLAYLVAMLGAYAGGFVLTWLFGVNEARVNEVYGEQD